MRTLVPLTFLAIVLAFFFPPVPAALRKLFHRSPKVLFLIPALLSAAFCLGVAYYGSLNLPLVLLIVCYTLVPVTIVFVRGKEGSAATWTDIIVILLLWLPVELNAGSQWIPRPIQGTVHTMAYGIALTLALVLFLGFRALKGMKYNLPHRLMDFVDPLIAFVIVTPVLIGLGLLLTFIPAFHLPANLSGLAAGKTFLVIFAGTALPEELLFRSLIQNWMMQKFGSTTGVLLVASFVFGCAHLNNGPGALPNWRYMILATIAGFAYGKVFQRGSSVISSALLHALVDTTKHLFF